MPDADRLTVEQAIDAFNTRVTPFIAQELDRVGEPEVPDLFHYSSVESTYNILKSGTIWATGIYHLNDATEVSYGAGVIAKCLASRPGIDQEVLDQFGNPEEFMKTAGKWPMFVFCLSQQPDLLSQWRAYGRFGGGVCIGFDRARLSSVVPKQGPVPTLSPVIYGQQEQRDLLNRVLDIAAEFYNRLAPGGDTKLYWLTALSLAAQLSFRFKDQAFFEEQEWRLLWLPGNNVQFRPAARTLLPYIEAVFCKTVVTKVVQGPLFNPAVGEDSLRMFLDSEGYSHVVLQHSRIPLRAL